MAVLGRETSEWRCWILAPSWNLLSMTSGPKPYRTFIINIILCGVTLSATGFCHLVLPL